MDAAHSAFVGSNRIDSATPPRPRHTPSISLVIPVYNEQQVILQAVGEAHEALATLSDDYEILIVDDGSTDATGELAARAAARYPGTRVITHQINRGYGAALRTGFAEATKEFVGFTDGDCQFDLRDLNRHLLLLSSCDVACGYRIDRQDSWLRNLYSRIYNVLVYLLLGTRVRDCDCALKLFRRDVLDSVDLTSDGFLINAEFLTKAKLAGKKIVEVGVTHRPRASGESTVSAMHVLPVLTDLLRLWWSTILFPSRVDPADLQTAAWGTGKTTVAAIALLVLSAILFFGNLGYPFVEPDENRYAQIALEMVQTGDYVVPRLNGEPYLDKPPLIYWSTAASFQAFGQSEMAARFPSALAATLTVLCLFLLGKRLLGDRVAFIGALMLFLCLGFVLSGRFLIMDAPLTLFTTISILAAFLATGRIRMHWGWWMLAAVTCGLGILTKGPIAVVLVAGPLIAMQWLGRGRVSLRPGHWVAFSTAALVITVPWFAVVGLQHGDFASHFFWRHHVVRFFTAFNHQEPIWYYIPVLLIGMFPSSLLAAPAAAFMFGRSESQRQLRTQELGAIAAAAAWIVAFFSLSSCKLPTYILPAVPFICLIQACMVHELWKTSRPPLALERIAHRIPRHATGIAFAVGAALAIADLALEPDAGIGRVVNYAMIATAVAALALLILHRSARKIRTVNWAIAAGASLLIMTFAFQKVVPEFADYRSVNANVGKLLATLDNKELPVVYVDWQIDGYSFYCPSLSIRWYTEDDLDNIVRMVRSHNQIMLIANRSCIELLEDELGSQVQFRRARGARGRIYLVSSSAPTGTLVGSHTSAASRRR